MIPSDPLTYAYLTDPSDALVVSGIGPIRMQDAPIAVTDAIGQPNTCSVTVGDHDGTPTPEPPVGVNVDIASLGRRLFAGTVITTQQVYEGDRPEQLKWHADLVDWTWQFNRLIPFGAFSGAADSVVAELVAAFAPGFTTAHVESGLPDVTLDLDGSDTLGGVLDDLCAQIGGAQWRVDYARDVHFGRSAEVDEVPDPLVDGSATLLRDPPVTYGRDLTQIRTRVFVRGTGCFATVDDLDAQAELAALVGGDGIYEGPVIERSELTTEAACTAYGAAVLTVWGRVITSIDYYTHDPKTAAGKMVWVGLSDPPISGEFLIQSVTIDEVAVNAWTFPRYHAVASSVRFTLEQVLGLQGSRNITGNAATASRLAQNTFINGIAYNGSADIDLTPSVGVQQSLRVFE